MFSSTGGLPGLMSASTASPGCTRPSTYSTCPEGFQSPVSRLSVSGTMTIASLPNFLSRIAISVSPLAFFLRSQPTKT